jgi:hypothetical protein
MPGSASAAGQPGRRGADAGGARRRGGRPELVGIDLAPLLLPGAEREATRWIFADLLRRRGDTERAAIRGNLKGITRFSQGIPSSGRRLFDLAADPGEIENQATAAPARMAALVS